MSKSVRFMRKVTLICGSGMVFQAAGCAFDPAALITELVTVVGTNLINSYVFGAFNLVQ